MLRASLLRYPAPANGPALPRREGRSFPVRPRDGLARLLTPYLRANSFPREKTMPISHRHPLLTRIGESRFAVLLFALLSLFLTVPIMQMLESRISPVLIRLIIGIVFVALVVAAVYAVSQSRKTRRTAAILAAPTVLLEALDVMSYGQPVHIAGHAFTMLFLGFTIVIILRYVFESERVTANSIFASLCVYLLMGTLWAYTYAFLGAVLPGSFEYSLAENLRESPLDIGGSDSISAFYFSFVTMTTLGFGDIVPVSSLAKMLSALQAVTGQLYLTVLVARLVGLHIAHSTPRQKS